MSRLTRADQKLESLTVVDAVQLKTVAGRVHLKIEHARLHRLLVEAGQPVEGGGEGVRDEEVHLNLTDGQLWVIPVEFRDRIDTVVSVPHLTFRELVQYVQRQAT